ncbi:MAG: tRNA 4-thiouridine(8) synthase ThiI [Candidatus Fraserbacteria bacterium RBG_16_55_9]|uniref:tRNA sulfurtransferase n=1 Tax=Fraserbacteria sp. (strain RBG_16_55_9) TaxID=1817864 RepID=A0A1F5V1R5_FRAXR|nr:MAG: tRNA 4-thiouridine(8) synthase ThiI [Candidatus Fraserbacteria bacterium RBG_16_55_9]
MLILIRFSGEISTKARQTRVHFTRRLTQNIKDALAGRSFKLQREWDRLYVETSSPEAAEALQRVFGIQSLSIVERRPGGHLGDVVQAGDELFRSRVKGKRFAVRARRAGDHGNDSFNSQDIARALGAALLPHALKVDLDNPEVTVYVEVRAGQAYFFTEQLPGPGGLPLGVEGRAVALVSGGFDSAVAAWFILKRGVALDYVFCNLGGAAHQQGVLRVLKILSDNWSYGDRPQLHSIDFQPLVKEMQAKTQSRYWQVLLKRLMYHAAEQVARERHSLGIVTGEAIGQVSSQTLQNLYVISQTAKLPVLRPLVGFNKEEIIAHTRRIGTYEISAAVDEYCAIVPRHPATRAPLEIVLAEEEKLDLALLERTIAEREVLDLKTLDPEELASPEMEIEEILEGAVVIDLRSPASYRVWHYPSAIYMDFFKALEGFATLDRDRTYVLYCELGLKSAHLAERMCQAGYRAFNFKGGMKNLLRYAVERDLVSPALLPMSDFLG